MSGQKLLSLGRQLCVYCCLLLLCCGCVQYRMELSFNWLTGGTIVQNLKWDSNVGNFIGSYSESAADELLEEIERRAAAAGGTADYVSDSEMRVEIPFDNYTQLESKFNAFFNQPLLLLSQWTVTAGQASAKLPPTQFDGQSPASGTALSTQSALSTKSVGAPALPLRWLAQNNAGEELQVTKHGFGIADRYDLTYTLDLSDVRLPVSGRFFTLSVDRLLDLQMALTTPVPASRSNATVRDGNRLEWHLDTGAVNHLSMSFWTPSPIGIVAIVVVALAMFLWVWQLVRPRRSG